MNTVLFHYFNYPREKLNDLLACKSKMMTFTTITFETCNLEDGHADTSTMFFFTCRFIPVVPRRAAAAAGAPPPAAAGAPPPAAATAGAPPPAAATVPAASAAVPPPPVYQGNTSQSLKRKNVESPLYNEYLEWEIKCSQEKMKTLKVEQSKMELEKELLTFKIKKIKMDIDGEHFIRALTEN